MEYNENFVEETENVEETTEETESLEETSETIEESDQKEGKFYTDEELDKLINDKVNEIADRRVARAMKKHEKEMAKYKDTENVLRSQIGGKDIDEVNANLRQLYTEEGRELPKEYQFVDDSDAEILGKAEAQNILKDGISFALDEANRLASIGYNNLSPRDKALFMELSNAIEEDRNKKELLSFGASKELLDDPEFKEFKDQFSNKTSIKKIYEIYQNLKEKPKEEIKTPGSLRGNTSQNEVKSFYTVEEARQFTAEDFEKNPKLLEAIENSMTKW